MKQLQIHETNVIEESCLFEDSFQFQTHGLDEGAPLNTLRVPQTLHPWTFFFRDSYLKNNFYGNKPRTIDALKLEIERQCRDIPNEMLRDVCESLGERYQRCLDNNGHQFEHLRT